MEWIYALLLLIGGVMVLLALGMPVAVSFIAVNVVGALIFLGGEAGLFQLTRNMINSVTNFSFTPIPMFLLMGDLLFHTGLAIKAIDAVSLTIRKVPGRLSVIALVAGTIFSAVSGSTIATTAMLCSLLLWLIISTLAVWRATAPKVRAAMPGTPIIPRPATVIICISLMAVMAFTPSGRLGVDSTMRVPGWVGLKVLSTRTGIFFSMAGVTVLGCSTLAP